MKVISLILFTLISSTILANEKPIFLGIIKGSIMDYYPQLKVSDVAVRGNVSTNGKTNIIVENAGSNTEALMLYLKNNAREMCKDDDFYALDNYSVDHQSIDFKYIFTTMTTNTVCLNKN
tara:strand:+ start:121 stop:480 length:360 start_codon:yes stop_codon:yes gene_type:complete